MMLLLRWTPIVIEFFGTVLVWLDTRRLNARNPPDGFVIGDKPDTARGIITAPISASRYYLSGFCYKVCLSRLNNMLEIVGEEQMRRQMCNERF
jgi:hypothetical protein